MPEVCLGEGGGGVEVVIGLSHHGHAIIYDTLLVFVIFSSASFQMPPPSTPTKRYVHPGKVSNSLETLIIVF